MINSEHIPPRPELVAFEAALPRMLPQHEGEYVVFKGDSLLRYFARYDEALEWAYSNLGLDSFFVKRITSAELNTVHYTRDLGPCRS
jgi:hypothetical protein